MFDGCLMIYYRKEKTKKKIPILTSIYYLLATIGFDTAENEPSNSHNFSSLQGFNFHRAVVSLFSPLILYEPSTRLAVSDFAVLLFAQAHSFNVQCSK